MVVRWAKRAANDLERIVRYIEKDSSDVAQRVAKTIFDDADALKQFPNRGRPSKRGSTRELTFAGLPYVLIYKVDDAVVYIVRIFHGAQDWP